MASDRNVHPNNYYRCEISPVTLTFELDLDSVKVNQQAKYLGQTPFSLRVIVHAALCLFIRTSFGAATSAPQVP